MWWCHDHGGDGVLLLRAQLGGVAEVDDRELLAVAHDVACVQVAVEEALLAEDALRYPHVCQ